MARKRRIIVANRLFGRLNLIVGGLLSSYLREGKNMTHLSKWTLTLSAALGATLLTADANVMAQCATCVPQSTVAFSPVVTTPVVTQPVVVTPTIVRTGWYPGYWIDRMRIN